MNKNIFNSVQLMKPKTNSFDLSHDVKLSLNMGDLVPIMVSECIPGDRFKISCESLLRFAPMVAPIMHRCDVTMHYFFVPNRIIWEGWEKFITNTKRDETGQLPAFPFTKAGVPDGGDHEFARYTKLHDYFGIPKPPDVEGTVENVSALPFAAYNKIWNEYYRDQNLQEKKFDQLVDGDNSEQLKFTDVYKRAWEHDYFTSALPFAQKGAAVEIPISGTIEFEPDAGANPKFLNAGTGNQMAGGDQTIKSGFLGVSYGDPSTNPAGYDPDGTLVVNNADTTINDLRRAFRLQEWLEKAARGGSRYIENILMHFGVRSSDKRLQRPEYITGVKSPVVISEVLNTTGTVDAPQGNMSGHGVSVVSGNYGNYYCEEHGYIIGIMSVMPKTAYMQGIPKHFLKTTDPFQYYWPSFANIGEQEILNKELYAWTGDSGNNTFGYTPRYAEYKYEQNRVAGDFRDTLDFWHMARKFASAPALNSAFISADPTHRIFAVEDPEEQKIWAHVYNKVTAIRPMPKFGTPML